MLNYKLQEQIKEIILENQAYLKNLEFFPRELAVLSLSKKPVVITGPRRAGKSTYLGQIRNDLVQKKKVPEHAILPFNFFDERIRPLDTKLLNQIEEAYCQINIDEKISSVYWFLDEIQLVPNWEYFVERIARQKNNFVFITGSSSKLLSKEIASALRGRPLVYELFPFSFKEFLDYKKIDTKKSDATTRRKIQKAFIVYLTQGGFPEVLDVDKATRNKIISEYYRMMLSLDLIERHNPQNSFILEMCLNIFFSHAGSLLSLNKVMHQMKSSGVSISLPMVSQFLSWVLDTYYLFSVPIFSASEQKRRVNPQKIYAIDNAVISATQSSLSKNFSKLLENFIFMELRRRTQEIFYYRTESGYEVDFIFQDLDTGDLKLIQSCYDLSDHETKKRELRAIEEAMAELKLSHSLIVSYEHEEIIKLGSRKKIEIIPAWKLIDHDFITA